MEKSYFESARKQFEYYKLLGDQTFAQLTDEQIVKTISTESNSIAIIVNHISGNMLSRWTDFLSSDGEKEWRNREQEFQAIIQNKKQLSECWEKGWKCLFEALDSINESNQNQLVYIRNQGHTIPEAIGRQLCHYAYHIGQITFIGKCLLNEQWLSLSIPKGNSEKYNEEKFSKSKTKTHFTDEYLDTKKKDS